ncbi:MAG: hypothetical protein D6689_18720 [Deltaproteobacteria bacterium]|nr:MAG: hypothetical protein D6689_18720 [Deltaproteobacteria bacterium]
MRSTGAWTAGAVVAGRFRLVAPVPDPRAPRRWRAEDLVAARDVALTAYPATDEFERHARAVPRAPGIPHVIDVGRVDDDSMYVATEWVRGELLSTALERIERFPVDRALRIAARIARVLDAAHSAGVAHGRLVPGRIVLSPRDGDDSAAFVLDLGIPYAEAPSADELMYRAPEQFATAAAGAPSASTAGSGGARADVYALTVILFEMVTGRPPFCADGDDDHAIARMHLHTPPPRAAEVAVDVTVSDEVEAILRDGLAKCAGDRIPSVAEFARRIEAARAAACARPAPRCSASASFRDAPRSPAAAGGRAVRLTATLPPPPAPVPGVVRAIAQPAPRARRRRALAAAATMAVAAVAAAAWAIVGARPAGRDARADDARTAAATPAVAAAAPRAAAVRRTAASRMSALPPAAAMPPPADAPRRPGASRSGDARPPASAPATVAARPTANAPRIAGATDGADRARPAGARGADEAGARSGAHSADEAGARSEAGADPGLVDPPASAAAAADRARALAGDGRWEQAIALLRQWRMRAPGDAALAALQGTLYLQRFWCRDGFAAYRDAFALDPSLRADPTVVRTAVRALGSRRNHRRAAEFILDEIGEPAIPFLEQLARRSASAAVRARAERVLARLRNRVSG